MKELIKAAPHSRLPDLGAIEAAFALAGDPVAFELIRKHLVEPAEELDARPSKRIRARLVRLGAGLIDDQATSKAATEICADAIELLHAGSLIVDDIQDGSAVRRGGPSLHLRHGIPKALCVGTWLYFWPLRLIRSVGLPPDREATIFRIYHDTVEKAHVGQALDVSVRADELRQNEVGALAKAIAELKTGSIAALAMSVGGAVAGANESELAAIGTFGRAFGCALQTCDDLGNTIGRVDAEKRREDLLKGKLTALWRFSALHLEPGDYARLLWSVHRLRDGEEAPLEEILRTFRLVDSVLEAARADLKLAFDALRAAFDRPSAEPAMSAIDQLCQELIRAYF